MKKKSYAIIVASSPYGSRHGKDALDMVLALSAFEQNILLLFEGDGVAHLSAASSAHSILKTYANEWAALPMYDVTNIAAVEEDCEQMGVRLDCEPLAVRYAPRAILTNEIAHCDIVLRF